MRHLCAALGTAQPGTTATAPDELGKEQQNFKRRIPKTFHVSTLIFAELQPTQNAKALVFRITEGIFVEDDVLV